MNPTVNEFIAVSLLFSFFIGFSWAINGCYNCSPEDKGCEDPIKSEMSTFDTCADFRPNESLPQGRVLMEQRARAGSEEVTYICATIQIRSTNLNKTGIYRTCLVEDSAEDGCDLLSTEFSEQGYGTSIGCATCNDNFCNHLTDETIQTSGKITFSSILLYTFVSSVFVTCVF